MGKKKDAVSSLGRSLIKHNQKKGHLSLSHRHGVDLNDGSDWAKLTVRSVTEQNTLEEFLTTAEMTDAQFTAERENIKIIDLHGNSPLNSIKSNELDERPPLLVPRRPRWDCTTTPEELNRLEIESFLIWRRELAKVQENDNVILTPFEKNIEFWRQLWRVIERSDVIVQILDARNPILFLCEDLQKYVNEVSNDKLNVILLNKSDFLTEDQRTLWALYFDSIGIKSVFFSALQQLEKDNDDVMQQSLSNLNINGDKNSSQLLSNEELLSYFKTVHGDRPKVRDNMVTIGLVGYPNVGKSSTINALLQSKRVSVSATPGKTKHFQTLPVDDELMLCDCPGLVFPNFVASKAEMIINGILPIDQMTDHIPPVSLLTTVIPSHVFEYNYGISLPKAVELNGHTTAEELLNAYGNIRGYKTQRGLPDTSRASRYILKHFVTGKLLYCHAPPQYDQKEYHHFIEKPKRLMIEPQKIINDKKASEEDFDNAYFDQKNMKVHSKGVHGVDGYRRVAPDYVKHCGIQNASNSSSLCAKPWKLHNNRKKKEKLRRVYADLDK